MCGEKGDGITNVIFNTGLMTFGTDIALSDYHDNHNVHFVVTMSARGLKKDEAQGFVEFFKLCKGQCKQYDLFWFRGKNQEV